MCADYNLPSLRLAHLYPLCLGPLPQVSTQPQPPDYKTPQVSMSTTRTLSWIFLPPARRVQRVDK